MFKKLDYCIFLFYKWPQHISLWLNITNWLSSQRGYLLPVAVTVHCGIMPQYIRCYRVSVKYSAVVLGNNELCFSSFVINLFLTSVILWLLVTIKYDYLRPKLFYIWYLHFSGIYPWHGIIYLINLVRDWVRLIFLRQFNHLHN